MSLIKTQFHGLDISKTALLSLKQHAIARLQEGRQTHTEAALHYQEVYWDGYIRALEHVLEMDGQ